MLTREQIPTILLSSAGICAIVFILAFFMLSLEPDRNKERVRFIKAVMIWSAILAASFVTAAVNRIE